MFDNYDISASFPLHGLSAYFADETPFQSTISSHAKDLVQAQLSALSQLNPGTCPVWSSCLKSGKERILSINASPVPDVCVHTLHSQGVTALELFGGLCGGLDQWQCMGMFRLF